VKCGSIAAAREKGLYRMEGKEYVVQDGDVLLFSSTCRAQTCSLPYRGFGNPPRVARIARCRLQVGETADYKSALRPWGGQQKFCASGEDVLA